MTRHESFTCDRCKSVFQKTTTQFFKILSENDLNILKDRNSSISIVIWKYSKSGLDLCSSCYDELESWIEAFGSKLGDTN